MTLGQDLNTIMLERELLFDALSEIVCVIDPEGVFHYVNKAVEKVLGYSREELIGKACFDFMPETDAIASRIAIAERMNNLPGGDFVNRYIHRNGDLVYVEWKGNYVRQNGLLFSIGKDVTEQRRLAEYKKMYEQKLKFSNRQMDALLEHVSDAMIQVDKNFDITYCNQQSETLLGKKRSDCIGTSLWDCPLVANYPEVSTKLKSCWALQQAVVFEFYFHALSSLVKVSFHPSRKGISIFLKDISLHKQTDAVRGELKLIEYFQHNAIILTDDEQRIIWVNKGFEKITGYTKNEVLGKIPSQLLNGTQTDMTLAAEMKEKLSKGNSVDALIQCHRKNGETYWSEVSIQPIFNRDGKLLHFLSIETDRTLQVNMEEQMAVYKREVWKEIEVAVDAAQEKERHQLAQELHDNVNQVLTTVKLYMEMLLHDKLDKAEILPRAMQNIQLCIDELRTISKRLSSPLPKQPANLGTQLSELAESINITEKINLSYSVEKFVFKPLPGQVQNAIWKTIQEQVNNILKYSNADLAHIRLWKDKEQVFLKVKDNGIGFNADTKNEGIGLQNMRQRATELNGSFQLFTEPGNGCEVLLTIPLN